MHQLLHFSPIILCSCNRTVEAANHTISIQLNPPITELITITIAEKQLIQRKKSIFKMEEYLTKDIVYPGNIFLGVFVFSEIEMVMTNW